MNIEEIKISSAQNELFSNLAEFKQYINNFETIILWGAGNLGKAIGRKFKELGLNFSYWDKNFKDLSNLDGISVNEPFTGNYKKKKLLLVFCISNGTIAQILSYKLNEVENFIFGNDLYQKTICPHNYNAVFDPANCTNNICNVRTCKKIDSLFGIQKPVGEDLLQLSLMGVIINQKCTLSCMGCSSYMNSYPKNERKNFPTKKVLNDIDVMLSTVDLVKQINIYGGEPFVHPDLDLIINKVLSYSNFVNVSLTTNLICKIDKKFLEQFSDKRFSISISDYREQLTKEQNELFNKNYELIKAGNVKYRLTKPLWIQPCTFKDKGHSVNTMIKMTADCRANTMCSELKNGKLFPCTMIGAVNSLGIKDFKSDYVELAKYDNDRNLLRSEIQKCFSMKYYKTCCYCGVAKGEQGFLEIPAGVQGKSTWYK